ncbi:CvpA family protein [Treponema sp.]|uniref:CvpA family protein n=1 Tax=Treponema sp. TaxID=166 RepID=UPI00388F024F
MNLPIIDLVFIIIIFALAIMGLINGFLNEVLGKVIPIASIWIAFMTFGHLVGPLELHVKFHVAAVICAFLIVFIVVFIVLKIIQAILKKIFSAAILKSLDRFLGFVFGAVEGVAIVCIVLLVLRTQPWFDTSSLLAGSIFLKYLDPLISIPADAITESVKDASAFIAGNGALNV